MALHSRLAAIAAAASLSLLSSLAGAQALGPSAIAQARAAGILDDKVGRTGAEKKLDESLLYAQRALQRGARRNTATPGVPAFVQGFIDRAVDDDLATFVTIRANATAELAAWLRASGARDVNEYAQFHGVTATVPVALLMSLGERSDVLSIGPRELADAAPPIAAVPNGGPVNWKGVTAHQADIAHAAGFIGSGVKVCVLADGVDSLAARVAAGELPATVGVLTGQAGSGNRGTAMLEIINDLAPGASLGFATSNGGTAAFASNIVSLRDTLACDIIVDGVSYVLESAFQDDNIAQAINTVTAAGAVYLSSAGDKGNLKRGTNLGTFEGDFVQSAATVPAVITAADPPPLTGSFLHQFPDGNPYTTLTQSTGTVTLKWSDPNFQSANDYDLFVTDPGATTIYGSATNGQSGTQNPRELASCSIAGPGPCDAGGTCDPGTGQSCAFPTGSRIYVLKWEGQARALRLDTHGGKITPDDATAGSTYGHNAAAAAITVGSVTLADVAASNPFTAANVITAYSSDGPRKIFYDPSGTAITAGNFLFATNGGTTLAKVNLVAGDCGATSTPGFGTFCGTSAAAPAAAAIAALIKGAKPTATRGQIAASLLASAIDIEQAGVDRDSGAGIVMAPAAVRAILIPLTFAKSYSPNSIPQGGSSTLTITISNPNGVALHGAAFTDTYPAPIVNAASPNATRTGAGCTGTPTATAGGNTIAVTNATVPAGGTCTFTVVVTVNAGGVYNDTSGTLTTMIGLNTPGSSAGALTVIAPSAQRAFVASFGTDANAANNCTFTNPCRSFAAAMTVLIPGGEIVALNAAGYGSLTIDKSVSIIANSGFYAGITAASGDGITIATPGVNVLLRGLNINGTGGVNGINMTAGTSLTMDNCVVTNFSGSGLKVDASGSSVRISNSVFSGNTVDGLQVAQGKVDVVRSRANGNGRAGFAAATVTGGAVAALSVVDTFASGNLYGFAAIANAAASATRISATRVTGATNDSGIHVMATSGTAAGIVGSSMFSQNNVGMFNSGTLNSLGNNLVDLNASNSSGTITVVPGL